MYAPGAIVAPGGKVKSTAWLNLQFVKSFLLADRLYSSTYWSSVLRLIGECMISLMTRSSTLNCAFAAPGVGAERRRTVVEPSGERPVETPTSCPLNPIASITRVAL